MIPTWRLRESLRREAEDIIEGRALFERDILKGKKSKQPLRPVEINPYELLQLLDEAEKALVALRRTTDEEC